jgi:hypothetical protein
MAIQNDRAQLTMLLLLTLLCCGVLVSPVAAASSTKQDELPTWMSKSERLEIREKVRRMFYHGFDNYMAKAFPHDELKPISGGWTDSLIELGNAKRRSKEVFRSKVVHFPNFDCSPKLIQYQTYTGCAMTLIDTLDTLAVLGDKKNIEKWLWWIADHLKSACHLVQPWVMMREFMCLRYSAALQTPNTCLPQFYLSHLCAGEYSFTGWIIICTFIGHRY